MPSASSRPRKIWISVGSYAMGDGFENGVFGRRFGAVFVFDLFDSGQRDPAPDEFFASRLQRKFGQGSRLKRGAINAHDFVR